MTMKSKQFHFESHDGKIYTALFSLTNVEDKEVYEFLAKEEEQKDFLHYGYITKAMAEKLLSKRERDGRMYIQSVSLKSNPRDIPQKQKIILDLPDEIDEKSFLPGGLPFQSASLTLYSKSYQEKLVPAVTIKPHSSFTFDTNESTVIFKFPNNEMECTNFMVGEFQEGSHNTIDLNIENSKAEEIIIQGVKPISSINNETYLWIKNKEREVIYVYGVLLPSNVEKKEALFNEGVSYIPIIANGAIRIYHAKIEADLNTITSCGIYSGGGIEVQDGDLAFGRGTSILQVGEGLSVENMKLVISGDNNIERSLGIETDSSCVKNDSLTIENIYSKNSLCYIKDQGSDKVEDTLKNSVATFENRSKDKGELSTISFLGGNVDILGAAHITTDTKRFIINQQGSGLQDVISFSGESFISAKEQVSIINGEFKGTNKIKSTSKGLTFLSGSIGNIITNSDINIAPKTKKGENEIEVDDLRINHAFLDNIKTNALTGDIYNAKITNCEMANGSVIYINRSEPKLPAYFTTIDNLIFKKKGMLFLDSGINNINKRVITNCVVEEGNFKIFDDGDYKLNNSILSHGEIIINNENREVIISNSNIKGYNKLENISSIDCSILENAEISSSKLIGLKDEMIIDQKILDYSASPAQPSQKEVSSNSIITNNIEIL